MEHIPVFKKEIEKLLCVTSGKVFADLTLGSGGHSWMVLEKMSKGILICFDIDKFAISEFEKRLKNNGFKQAEVIKEENIEIFSKGRNLKVILINSNFSRLAEKLKILKIESLDGIIVDLGWSVDQLGKIEGLSFGKFDEDLDMRLDKSLGVKASDLLNVLNKTELSKMFDKYADIKGLENSKLVNEILNFRKQNLFVKTKDLTQVVEKLWGKESYGSRASLKNKARVFQALRIAVNQELLSLEELLKNIYATLSVNGLITFITFHSIEERFVDESVKKVLESNKYKSLLGGFGEYFKTPSVEELTLNLRARSAKLWAIQRIK